MRIQTIHASTGLPINLEDLKDHLRIPTGETREDSYLQGLIETAAARVEEMTNRALTRRTLKIYFDDWPDDDYFELPYPPLSTSTDAVLKYVDVDSSTVTVSSTAFKLVAVSEPGRLILDYNEDWPSNQLNTVNPISIQFSCGYKGSTAVPHQLKHAMKLLIGDLYEHRETISISNMVFRIPDAVQSLVRSLRIFKA